MRIYFFPLNIRGMKFKGLGAGQEQFWFVESPDGGPYSARYIQAVFHRALEKAKLDGYSTVHTLRQSCATYLLQIGVDLRHIPKAIGLESHKTTEIYTCLAADRLLSRILISSDFIAQQTNSIVQWRSHLMLIYDI